MPLELLTMLGTTLIGGILKIWGMSMENKKLQHQTMMEAAGIRLKATNAARNFQGQGFQWTRRMIALTITFSVFIVPQLAAIFAPEVPILIGYTEIEQGFLFFTDDQEVVKWVEVPNGLTLTPLHTHGVMAILGLYFGGSIVGHNR